MSNSKAKTKTRSPLSFLKKISLSESTGSKIPVGLSYLYLAIPMYIFMFGWLKLPLAIIMAALLSGGLYKALKNAPAMEVTFFARKQLPKLIMVVLIAAAWVYLSGIGGYSYQNQDHMWRNAVLAKLVSNDWPVIITETGEYFENPVALIYYFALWLPAACVGKMFGMAAAQTFLFWWCVAGVSLLFMLISGLNKKISPWLLIAFIFFSGLDAVGYFILHNSADHIWLDVNHIENWAYGFQMSSFCTQLFWVYNQAIPAWIITALLLCQKDNRSVIFIYSFSFLACSLPAIGMLPVLCCIGITRIVKTYDKTKPFKENLQGLCKEAFTFQNVFTGVPMALVSYLFFKANTSGTVGFRKTDMERLRMTYLIFILLEFLVYYFAIFKTHKREPLYWVTLATLLIVPMISFGYHVDFVMRTSIPSLVVLFVMVTDSIEKNKASGDKRTNLIIIALLLAGGITAYHEIGRSVRRTAEHCENPDTVIDNPEIDLYEDGARRNFFGEYQDSLFFKYFAKKN